MPNYKCLDLSCKFATILTNADHRFMSRHYRRKTRDELIKLAKEHNVSSNPFAEPTFIMAEKLADLSRVKK